LEALLAGYSLAGIGIAIFYGEIAAIPFQGMYFFGYGFIAFMSFKQYFWPRVLATFSNKTRFERLRPEATPA
jgi:hypothetical protein